MLEVKEIPVSNDSHPKPKHAVLPKHEFTMGVIAPKGSGKTTLLINLLEFYKGYFHHIIIFSPSIKNDEKWNYAKKLKLLVENKNLKACIRKITYEKNKHKTSMDDLCPKNVLPDEWINKASNSKGFQPEIPEDCFITAFNESDLQEIVDQQQEMIDFLKDHGYSKTLANRILIIFDDLVGSSLYNRSQKSVFKTLNANHRHLSMSMLEVSQAYKEIPKTVRTNFTCLILFKMYNEQEKKVIYEEYPMGLSTSQWENVYRQCTKEPHSFMFIDTLKPEGLKIMKNFNSIPKFK